MRIHAEERVVSLAVPELGSEEKVHQLFFKTEENFSSDFLQNHSGAHFLQFFRSEELC